MVEVVERGGSDESAVLSDIAGAAARLAAALAGRMCARGHIESVVHLLLLPLHNPAALLVNPIHNHHQQQQRSSRCEVSRGRRSASSPLPRTVLTSVVVDVSAAPLNQAAIADSHIVTESNNKQQLGAMQRCVPGQNSTPDAHAAPQSSACCNDSSSSERGNWEDAGVRVQGDDEDVGGGGGGRAFDVAAAHILVRGLCPAVVASLLHSCSTLTSKLVQALLVQHSQWVVATSPAALPAVPWSAAATSSAPPHQTTATAPAADPAWVAAARQLLALLGGPAAIAGNPELRWVVSEQLLAGKTLPTPAMLLLLELLAACGDGGACSDDISANRANRATHTGPPSLALPPEAALPGWWRRCLLERHDEDNGGGGGGVGGNMNVGDSLHTRRSSGAGTLQHDDENIHGTAGRGFFLFAMEHVAACIAALWGDVSGSAAAGGLKETKLNQGQLRVSSSPAPPGDTAAAARAGSALSLQGYTSCVLVALLTRLSKSQVEACPGLLPALLRGVSHRLGSPQLVVRQQGMRVGRVSGCGCVLTAYADKMC
jgi:hypothetical protein